MKNTVLIQCPAPNEPRNFQCVNSPQAMQECSHPDEVDIIVSAQSKTTDNKEQPWKERWRKNCTLHYQIINTKFQQKTKVANACVFLTERVCVSYVVGVGVFVCVCTCVHVSVCVCVNVQTPYSRPNYTLLTVTAWGCMW